MSVTKRKLGWLLAAGVIGACATVVGTRAGSDSTAPRPPEPSMEDGLPPVVVPPLAREQWKLPAWESTDPYFPYLPGEDRERSRSVGDVSSGWLVNAVQIPQPHSHMSILPVHAARGLDYTTQEMLDLVEKAAKHVAASHEGSVLHLGNFSADGGGDIPYSVSHNSGRDADLAFYVLDTSGKPVDPPDLLPLDDDGKFTGTDGKTYVFDAARNWKLIEGLVEHGRGSIQYVFISNPLRKALLEEARRVGADADVVAHAAEILTQPGGALPHNDHFHVRLFCSQDDVRSGCENEGRKVAGYESFASARDETIKTARKLLGDEDGEVRLAAVRRLELMRDRGGSGAVAKRLDDDDPRVRAAAGRALSSFGREESAVAKRLKAEKDPLVRAELIWALGSYGTKSSVTALAELLSEPQRAVLVDQEIDLRVLIADALAVAEDKRPVEPLIALTKSEDDDIRLRAHRALTMLTNFEPAVTEADLGATWEAWYAKHRKLSRDKWLILGFEAKGLEVPRLAIPHVWELCKAVLDADYLSYNAQRVLMRLARKSPPSLQWSKNDANFYWRRWFERRCNRLGCPPVPAGMSTLDE